jgi:DNA primase
MDALTVVNEHIDFHKLLEHYDFDKVKTQGLITRSCCKLHGGDNPMSFVVNHENNLFYCHTNCGGGDAYTLVEKLEGIESFPEQVKRVAQILGVNIDNLEIMEKKPSYMSELKKWVKAMQVMKKKAESKEYTIPEPTRAVKKYRDFKPETLEHFGLSYVESITLKKRDGNPYTLQNRLVFPIYWEGVMIGASLRKIKSTDFPKWSHQPTGIDTRNYLYNYDNVLGKERIVVCEGMTDVWAYHEIGIPAVCTFGAHVTDEQYALLMKTGAELVWSYDGDKAGVDARNKAIEMFRYKADQYYVEFNEGDDPATITREELKERYDRRKRTA